MKRPQTIGNLERAHSDFKRTLKNNLSAAWSNRYKYVDVATSGQNISSEDSSVTTPINIFHSFEPAKLIDLRSSRNVIMPEANSHENDLQITLLTKFEQTKTQRINSYHEHRSNYDQKTAAQTIEKYPNYFLLNPLLKNQSSGISKKLHLCLPLYRFEQVLTKSVKIFRKNETKYSQEVHRHRILPTQPQYEILDLSFTGPCFFRPDFALISYQSEAAFFD